MASLPEEVEKKTQKYMEEKGFSLKSFLGRFFLEHNPAFAYLAGILTATGLYFHFLQNISWPLIAWVVFYFTLSVIRTIYWYFQVKRSEKELKRIEGELKALDQEIKKGKAYFENLRDQKGISGKQKK